MIDKVAELLEDWKFVYKIENGKIIVKGSKWKIGLPPVNEDIAYVLGFVCGDGCLVKPQPRKTGGYRFRISISLSGLELEKTRRICNIFRRHFHCEPSVIIRKPKGKRDWIEINVNSVAVYAYFCVLGFPTGKKYGKLKVPSVVNNYVLFKHFLIGLIDSDGHIQENRRVTVVQKDACFLSQIREACLKYLGIRFSVPKPNSKTVGRKTYTWYYIIYYSKDISRNSFDWIEKHDTEMTS